MEQLKQSQLKYIIKKLPVIQIEFDDWDVDEKGRDIGSYYNENYEIYSDDVFIKLELCISSSYSSVAETLISPTEYTQQRTGLDYEIKTVMIDEDEYTLTTKQLRQLEKAIINNLEY